MRSTLAWARTLSLRKQLIISIAVTHAVLMTVFVLDMVNRQRDFIHKAEQTRAMGLAQTLALNGRAWVAANDLAGLQELVKAYSSFPEMEYVLIMDSEGLVLAHNDPRQVGRYVVDPVNTQLLASLPNTQILTDNQLVLEVAAPVQTQSVTTGWVRLGLNANIDARIRSVVTRQGILYTVIAILVGIASAALIGSRITRSLSALLSVVKATQAGQRQERVPVIRNDEVGELARSFNEMLDEIEHYDHERQLRSEEISELNVTLEKRVEQRTQELRSSMETLSKTIADLKDTQKKLVEQEKMASLGALVAGVAHEINTPLGVAITANSHLEQTLESTHRLFTEGKLTRNEYQQATENMQETVTMVTNNLERAAQLVKSFKRLAVDQTSEVARRFELNEYLDTIVISLSPALKRTHHEIKREVEANLYLFCDPGTISQIFTNLIMNSITHGFEGIDAGVMLIKARSTGKSVVIDYFDNGKGVAPEIKHRIFEPFVTTHRQHGGSGLGTHIIYTLVTQVLKGEIVFDAAYARGTHFTITLPAAPPVSG